MSFITKYFHATENQLIRAAESLPHHAAMTANDVSNKLRPRFPALEAIQGDRWRLIFVPAAAYIAAYRMDALEAVVEDELADKVLDIMDSSLAKWSCDAIVSYLAIYEFFNSTALLYQYLGKYSNDHQQLLMFLVGSWMHQNLFDRLPAMGMEQQLSHTCGLMVYEHYIDYWYGDRP